MQKAYAWRRITAAALGVVLVTAGVGQADRFDNNDRDERAAAAQAVRAEIRAAQGQVAAEQARVEALWQAKPEVQKSNKRLADAQAAFNAERDRVLEKLKTDPAYQEAVKKQAAAVAKVRKTPVNGDANPATPPTTGPSEGASTGNASSDDADDADDADNAGNAKVGDPASVGANGSNDAPVAGSSAAPATRPTESTDPTPASGDAPALTRPPANDAPSADTPAANAPSANPPPTDPPGPAPANASADDPDVVPLSRLRAAEKALKQRSATTDLEAKALDADPAYLKAKTELDAASAQASGIDAQYRAALLDDPGFKNARDQLVAARARMGQVPLVR